MFITSRWIGTVLAWFWNAPATSTKGYIGMVMSHDPEPKVSIDFNHTAQSSIFAPDQTKVAGGRTVRVLAW